MNDLSAVEAYINSPEHQAWERATVARWLAPAARARIETDRKERLTVLRNAATARRRSAKMLRMPRWADATAIRQIYAAARALSRATGTQHHVDHIYPLQGRLVSGLHVAGNLQILPGADNCRKSNRFEVEP